MCKHLSKHLNKHWLYEKEYFSLYDEYISYDTCGFILETTREYEIYNRLINRFYNLYKMRNAPKSFRKIRNKSQKAKSKQTLIKILKGYNIEFNDNYKDAFWYYW
jgi:hypothetical protein